MKLLLAIYLCIYACVSAESSEEANETDPKLLANFRNFEACLNNFDIHKDKIIRTEDSRAMGAKYISESDMNTREECLRMCCVTDTCDVFVFEEKRPGSCYLFNCGSAADFKCKFTKHHNYTSGVLTLDHQMHVALDPNTPSKHEQELNQLRRPEGVSVMSLNLTFGATSQPQLPLQGTSQASNKTMDQSHVKMRQCSRFQFKCRTSGECIAIYNACDGIPQCSDGSDESPELGCPAPVTSSPLPIVPSSGNKTEQEDSLPKLDEIPYHLRPEKMSLPDKLENVEADIQSEQTMTGGQIYSASGHSHRIQTPLSTSNILKQPEINHISSPMYETVHQEVRFKKPDEPLERNSSPEFSGFRQYLSPHRQQDSEKADEEENGYIAVKLMAERNKDAEHIGYNHKSQHLNLQSHIKSNFLQSGTDISDLNDHSEHIATFQNAEHSAKTHTTTQIELKKQQQQQQHLQLLQQQSGLANALRHQLTNIHLSEMQPEVFQKEHAETKETKFSLRNQAHSPHTTRIGSQIVNADKTGAQEIHVEVDNEHQLRNDMKDQLQVSYQEPPFQVVPERAYKYEDEDRHIFNHKGYGLVAESDSSEIPYKIAVPNVQYKINSAQSNGFMNSMEYGNKMQRNMREEQIHPTSHELKILKNTPQPVNTVDNGYPLPSDYMYDEGHSILNAVSLLSHRPNSDHHLPTLRASTAHVGGSLERTSLSRGSPSHRDHAHDSVSDIMVSNNANTNEPDVSLKHETSAYKKGKQKSIHAVATTSDTAEVPKDKHEENHHEHFVRLQQAYISEIPNDQQQDRPNGALLSMSFGLCITFAMVVLVACRLRVVKRRLRRNGKSLYAHDADYLVNGMYL